MLDAVYCCHLFSLLTFHLDDIISSCLIIDFLIPHVSFLYYMILRHYDISMIIFWCWWCWWLLFDIYAADTFFSYYYISLLLIFHFFHLFRRRAAASCFRRLLILFSLMLLFHYFIFHARCRHLRRQFRFRLPSMMMLMISSPMPLLRFSLIDISYLRWFHAAVLRCFLPLFSFAYWYIFAITITLYLRWAYHMRHYFDAFTLTFFMPISPDDYAIDGCRFISLITLICFSYWGADGWLFLSDDYYIELDIFAIYIFFIICHFRWFSPLLIDCRLRRLMLILFFSPPYFADTLFCCAHDIFIIFHIYYFRWCRLFRRFIIYFITLDIAYYDWFLYLFRFLISSLFRYLTLIFISLRLYFIFISDDLMIFFRWLFSFFFSADYFFIHFDCFRYFRRFRLPFSFFDFFAAASAFYFHYYAISYLRHFRHFISFFML